MSTVISAHVVFGDLVPLRELLLLFLDAAAAMRPARGTLGPLPAGVGPGVDNMISHFEFFALLNVVLLSNVYTKFW